MYNATKDGLFDYDWVGLKQIFNIIKPNFVCINQRSWFMQQNGLFIRVKFLFLDGLNKIVLLNSQSVLLSDINFMLQSNKYLKLTESSKNICLNQLNFTNQRF